MTSDETFSVAKLPAYPSEQIGDHMKRFDARAGSLTKLISMYNDKARYSLDERSVPQNQQLANAQYWSNLRDQAKDMAAEAQKKAHACKVELDLRQAG